MPKINVKAMLHNITEDKYFSSEVVGIFIDNKLKFIDEGKTVIINLKDNDIYMNRSCEEYDIHMSFILNEKTTGIYNIKKLGTLNLDVFTTNLKLENNVLEINYSMIIDNSNIQKFNYKIEFKEL